MILFVAHAGHWLETVAMTAPLLALPIVIFFLVRAERRRSSSTNSRH